jgi:hypothetical protein
MKDPSFLKEAHEGGVDVSPVPGERLQTIVSEIVNTPPEVARRAREAMHMGGGGSAAR